MSFSFPSFSPMAPRFPTAQMPLTPPTPMPTFDDDELDDVDANPDVDETDEEEDPDEGGDDTSID